MTQNNNAELATKIAKAVNDAGGVAYFVGGYVRDKLMNIPNKDIDIEVHGIEADVLEKILDQLGTRLEFGKSFGIYSLKDSHIDIALPRKESCIGTKHTDFKIDTDPHLGTLKAARRRDFSINALMQNILTGDITDHFDGINDIKSGVIRHIDDEAFKEDSLRVLRAAQFAARFNFKIADDTISLCKKMSIDELSSERVFDELKKALIKADKPSIFFDQLQKMGHTKTWFSKVFELKNIPQSKKYHSEGDVYIHTMMVLAEASKLKGKTSYPLWFMISALVHDFGKAVTTSNIDGVIHAYRHESEGTPLIKEFLQNLTNEKKLIEYVINMTEQHMKPHQLFASGSSVKATNKMFDSCVCPIDLIYLSTADCLGKLPKGDSQPALKFLTERLNIYNEYMSRPYVDGADLISAGIKPGKEFSALLSYAHKLRLSGVKKELALKQTLSLRRQLNDN